MRPSEESDLCIVGLKSEKVQFRKKLHCFPQRQKIPIRSQQRSEEKSLKKWTEVFEETVHAIYTFFLNVVQDIFQRFSN